MQSPKLIGPHCVIVADIPDVRRDVTSPGSAKTDYLDMSVSVAIQPADDETDGGHTEIPAAADTESAGAV